MKLNKPSFEIISFKNKKNIAIDNQLLKPQFRLKKIKIRL